MVSLFFTQVAVFAILFGPLFLSVASIGLPFKNSVWVALISLSYFLCGLLSLILLACIENHHSSIQLLGVSFWFNKLNLLFVSAGNIVNSFLLANFNKELKKMEGKVFRVFVFLNSIAVCCFCNIAFSHGMRAMTAFYFFMVISIYFSMDSFKEKKQDYNILVRYLKGNVLPFAFFLLPSVVVLCLKAKTAYFVVGGSLSVEGNEVLFGILLAMFIFGVSMSLPIGFSDWILDIKEYSKFTAIGLQTIFVNASIMMVGNVINYFFGQENIRLLMSNFVTGGWLIYFFSFHGLVFSIKALRSREIIQKTSFSTLSQTGYTISALLLATDLSFLGVVLWMFFHAFAKAGLLMIGRVAYAFYGRDGKKESIEVLSKNGLIIPYIGMGFSIAGVPPLAGFFSKKIVFLETWQANLFVPAVIVLLSAVINIMYIWPGIKGVLESDEKKLNIVEFFKIKSFPLVYVGPIWACFFLILAASFFMRIGSFFN